MNLRDMLARRATIAAELRGLNDKPGGENGDLSTEQRARWDALKGELDGLEQRIGRQAAIDDVERRTQGQPVSDGHFNRAFADVGLLDVARAAMGGTDRAAGLAREASQEMERRSGRRAQGMFWHMGAPADVERRTLTTALPAGGPGDALIPADYRPDAFIDRLRRTNRVRAMGATMLTGLTGNVTIPRRKASVAAGWVAENTALPNTDPQFDGVTLSPKHAGTISEWSRNMIMQASPDVEQLARDDMAAELARTLDVAAINGSGAGAEPRGILNTSGIGSVAIGTNGGAITFDALADLMGAVDDVDATGGSMGFLTNTKVRRAAAKVKDGQGNPLGVEVMFQGLTPTITNNVPSNLTKGTGTGLSPVFYGNWSDLLIGVWSELDILVNPYEATAYAKGNVQIRAMMTLDLAVRHPESFAAIKDVLA